MNGSKRFICWNEVVDENVGMDKLSIERLELMR